MINSASTIWWVEKLLQTPIDDYRKMAVWHILVPYLINIRQLSDDNANETIWIWLDKCRRLRRLDFNVNYMIRYNTSSVASLDKLKTESSYLYKTITEH
jgi:Primase X